MSGSKFKVASLFCGIGGLDLGFEWGGFDVVWASDIMPSASESYLLNFGRPSVAADINTLPLNLIPDVDVIIGGPPCQSFSLVGQRRPDDERGNLVFKFVEVIRAKKPKAFVMENVPGLAASKIDERRLTEVLVEEFTNLGYSVTAMKLDASNYLVPQKRKRIFLVGVQSEEAVSVPDPTAFAKECYGIDWSSYDNGAAAAIGDLGDSVAKASFSHYNASDPSTFAQLMRRSHSGAITLHETPRMSETDKVLISFIPPGGNFTDVPDEFATQRILNFKKTGGRTTTYGRLHPDRPSYTVNTYFRRPNVGSNFHYAHPRLITAREAMRLQSIPDHFSIVKCSQDVRNTLIGNAVPPLLGHAVAWALRQVMQRSFD